MKNTSVTFKESKKNGEKLTMLTAYDYTTAKLLDESGIDSILVGDSLGMVVLGYDDTLSVTMEDMIHHSSAVARGAKNALVITDMPFMSYQTSVYDAVVNAGRLVKEGKAQAVKLEGGIEFCEHIKAIPSVNASFFLMISDRIIPAIIAITGAPITSSAGRNITRSQEGTAIARQSSIPKINFFI